MVRSSHETQQDESCKLELMRKMSSCEPGHVPLLEFSKNRTLEMNSDDTLDALFPYQAPFEIMSLRDDTNSTVFHHIFERVTSPFILEVAARLLKRPKELRLVDLTFENNKGLSMLGAIDRAQATAQIQWKNEYRGNEYGTREHEMTCEMARRELPRKIRLAWKNAVDGARELVNKHLIPDLSNIVMQVRTYA
jgi:hypothetical protein